MLHFALYPSDSFFMEMEEKRVSPLQQNTEESLPANSSEYSFWTLRPRNSSVQGFIRQHADTENERSVLHKNVPNAVLRDT